MLYYYNFPVFMCSYLDFLFLFFGALAQWGVCSSMSVIQAVDEGHEKNEGFNWNQNNWNREVGYWVLFYALKVWIPII